MKIKKIIINTLMLRYPTLAKVSAAKKISDSLIKKIKK